MNNTFEMADALSVEMSKKLSRIIGREVAYHLLGGIARFNASPSGERVTMELQLKNGKVEFNTPSCGMNDARGEVAGAFILMGRLLTDKLGELEAAAAECDAKDKELRNR